MTKVKEVRDSEGVDIVQGQIMLGYRLQLKRVTHCPQGFR